MTSGIQDTKSTKALMGSRIKAAREKKGLKRTTFIEIINKSNKKPTLQASNGLAYEQFKKWETGENPVNVEWIPAICETLSIDCGYLFGEYEENTRVHADICRLSGLSEAAADILIKSQRQIDLENTIDTLYSAYKNNEITDHERMIKAETVKKSAENSGLIDDPNSWNAPILRDIINEILTSEKLRGYLNAVSAYANIYSVCNESSEKRWRGESIEEACAEYVNSGVNSISLEPQYAIYAIKRACQEIYNQIFDEIINKHAKQWSELVYEIARQQVLWSETRNEWDKAWDEEINNS